MEETKMGRGDKKKKNDHESEKEIQGNREWNKRKHRMKLMETENEIRGNTEGPYLISNPRQRQSINCFRATDEEL